MKPKGWRGESRRHSMARKGIGTAGMPRPSELMDYINKKAWDVRWGQWKDPNTPLSEHVVTDEQLKFIVGSVIEYFKNEGKQVKTKDITEKNLVFDLSIAMRWFTPKEAQSILNTAEHRGFIDLKEENNQYFVIPKFDTEYWGQLRKEYIARNNKDNVVEIEKKVIT